MAFGGRSQATAQPAAAVTGSTGGTGSTGSAGSTASTGNGGAVLDLSNPAYRARIIGVVTSWYARAPIGGIHLDSADLLVGDTVRRDIGPGARPGTACCAARTPRSARTATAAGSTRGTRASSIRNSDRNQHLLSDASIADNEDYCWDQGGDPENTGRGYVPPAGDIAMMQAQAAAGKQPVEITHYGTADDLSKLGSYCVGACLMGWQPGYDGEVFHAGYGSAPTTYPAVPEMDLDLGDPSAQASTQRSLLTRTFQHGYVAVDDGDSAVTLTLPEALVQYAGGQRQATYAAGGRGQRSSSC